MTIVLSSAPHTANHGVKFWLVQVLIAAVVIVVAGELARWLLRYLPRSAAGTVSARLDRARAVAAKLGIYTGKGNLRKQFDTLNRQDLGLVGWMRYVRSRKRLLSPTPKSVLQFHSRRDYLRDRLWQFLMRCTSLFQLRGIISIENFRILLIAGAIVVIKNEHMARLKPMAIQLRNTIPWHSIAEWLKEWYVLLALVIVALIVATRSPLVDRIRARDEAAKDTNRLLVQLYAKLTNVARSAANYLDVVDQSRAAVVASAVEEATRGLYTWTYEDGLRPPSYRRRSANAPERWSGTEADELEQACKELSDHLAEYRRNGLHTVAFRLTQAVFFSLYECSIMFSNAKLSVHLRTHLMLGLSSQDDPRIRNIVYALRPIADAEGHNDVRTREFLHSHEDDAVRNYANSLDMRLASAYTTLLHLNHINSFLNKRLHGTTRSRLAGSLVR